MIAIYRPIRVVARIRAGFHRARHEFNGGPAAHRIQRHASKAQKPISLWLPVLGTDRRRDSGNLSISPIPK